MIHAILNKMVAVPASLLAWVDRRFPITKIWNEHLAHYYVPKNFNFWYFFGSLALVVLAIQIITGIFLTMNYKPSEAEAFASVEFIMRDVNYGWLIRYMHSTGASAFFIVVYLHMFRGLMYGSYKQPRELLWILGMLIYMTLMAEAFLGYLLPWGQMSFWGAQVIVSLFEAMPFGIGLPLAEWIRGDFTISDATLNRFFAYHVIAVPLALLALVAAHIIALHEVGPNNPDGIDINDNQDDDGVPLDGIPFHPYYTVKDIVGVVVFLIFFFSVVFYAPEMGGWFLEHNNFLPADPLKTPEHIAPLWYFTPFYSILRAFTYPFLGIDAKLWGVLAMGFSQLLFFFLPWLDRSPVRSIRYRGPYFRCALYSFALAFVVLGYLGVKSPTETDLFLFNNTVWAQIFTVVYFAFFLLMPWYTKMDNDEDRPLPARVTG